MSVRWVKSDHALRKRLVSASLDTKLILHAHGPRICDSIQPPPITSKSTPGGHQNANEDKQTTASSSLPSVIGSCSDLSVDSANMASGNNVWSIASNLAFLFPAFDGAFLYIGSNPSTYYDDDAIMIPPPPHSQAHLKSDFTLAPLPRRQRIGA